MPRNVLPEDPTRLAALVEDVTALAEHARVHGRIPDCGARMDALIAKHRARIEFARRIEADALNDRVVAVL